VQPLHRDVRRAVGKLSEIGNVDDVRIADRRSGPRLLQETVGDFFLVREVAAQDLDGYALVDELVPRQVDDPHSAFAEDGFDPVAAVEDRARVTSDGRRGSRV